MELRCFKFKTQDYTNFFTVLARFSNGICLNVLSLLRRSRISILSGSTIWITILTLFCSRNCWVIVWFMSSPKSTCTFKSFLWRSTISFDFNSIKAYPQDPIQTSIAEYCYLSEYNYVCSSYFTISWILKLQNTA